MYLFVLYFSCVIQADLWLSSALLIYIYGVPEHLELIKRKEVKGMDFQKTGKSAIDRNLSEVVRQ